MQGSGRRASRAVRDLKSLTEKLVFRPESARNSIYPWYWKLDTEMTPESGRFEDHELIPTLQAMVGGWHRSVLLGLSRVKNSVSVCT